jgi:signal transduction histidine kinase
MEGQTTEKLVRVSALRQDGVAQVTVEDSGPGISEDVLAHIFEPLFSTKNFGVGLGTNIAKNIVDRHQGTLHYSNRPAGGARVVLTLPCIDGGVPASDQA